MFANVDIVLKRYLDVNRMSVAAGVQCVISILNMCLLCVVPLHVHMICTDPNMIRQYVELMADAPDVFEPRAIARGTIVAVVWQSYDG